VIQFSLGFLIPFAAVFLKVFQHQNVIHRRITWAALNSFAIQALDITTVGLIIANGWAMLLPSGCGAALGVALSMWVHPQLLRWMK